jgi:hypothetical protein
MRYLAAQARYRQAREPFPAVLPIRAQHLPGPVFSKVSGMQNADGEKCLGRFMWDAQHPEATT